MYVRTYVRARFSLPSGCIARAPSRVRIPGALRLRNNKFYEVADDAFRRKKKGRK